MPKHERMNAQEEGIFALVQPLSPFQELGVYLVSVKIQTHEGKRLVLYCDRRGGGIDFDTLTELSRRLDPLLERTLPSYDYDFFDLSSPGAERYLGTPIEYEVYAQTEVQVKLYEGWEDWPKEFTALLLGAQDGRVGFAFQGKEAWIPEEQVVYLRRFL